VTVLDKLEKLPPYLCRLLARTRNGRRGLSHNELAALSGLNRCTIKNLSVATSWAPYTLSTVMAFATACGVNHLSARRHVKYLKHTKRYHIVNASGNQARLYARLKKLLVTEASKRKQASGGG
jgi:response regulator of citrate/malate metabolism